MLILNPITNRKTLVGSGPHKKMLRQIANNRFSTTGWTQRRLDALDGIQNSQQVIDLRQERTKVRQAAAARGGATRRANLQREKEELEAQLREVRQKIARETTNRKAGQQRRRQYNTAVAELQNIADDVFEDDLSERVAKMLAEHMESDEPTEVFLAKNVIDDERWDIVRERVNKLKLKPNVRYNIIIDAVVQEGVELNDGSIIPIATFSNKQQEDTDFARNVLGKDVIGKVIDFFLHWESNYVVFHIVSLSIHAAPSANKPASRELQKQILQKVGRREDSVRINMPGVDQNITDDGTCGYAMHENHFKLKRSVVQKILNTEDAYGGVTNQGNVEVCKFKKTGIIIIDVDGRILYKKSHDEDGRNHNYKTLMYVFANQHFYPVTDDAFRRALMQEQDTMEKCTECAMERNFDIENDTCEVCGNSSWSMDADKNGASTPAVMANFVPNFIRNVMVDEIVVDEINPDLAMDLVAKNDSLPKGETVNVIVRNGDLQDLLVKTLKEHNELPDNRSIKLTKVTFTERVEIGEIERHRLSIAKMRYGNVVFERNQDYDYVSQAAQVFHIPFSGQTVLTMLLEYFQICNPDAGSSYNDCSLQWFPNTHLALTRVFKQDMTDEKISAIDLSRSYENAARMKRTPWAIVHSMDFSEPYQPQNNPINNLKPGKYFISFIPCLSAQPLWFQRFHFPDGCYHHEFVTYLHRRGVQFFISQQILSQTTLVHNVFNKMFNVAYKALPDAVAKDNIRKFIGMLNKRVRRKYKTTYSTDEEDLHPGYLGKGFIRQVDDDVFQGFTFTESTLQENYVPLYQQIIEMSWISMIEMARTVPVDRWIMVKTDELVYLGEATLNKKISYEGREICYKPETIDEKKRAKLQLFQDRCPSRPATAPEPKRPKRTWKYLDNSIWTKFKVEEILKLGSFAVNGEGGTGKSYIVKKLVEHLGAAVLLTSSTHVTAIDIKGDTLHSGLRYDKVGKCFMIKKKDVKFTHIIIDEALMLDRDVLRAIYWLRKTYPKLHFILLGDPTQLPPVMHRILRMKYDISTNPLFMEICDFKMFFLTENYRNPELTELYKHVAEKDFPDRVGKNVDTKLHVVIDNVRRRKLGAIVAEAECKRLRRKKAVVKTSDGDFIIFRSMKVYANDTHRGLNITNRERFTVSSNQAADGTFSLKSDVRNHSIVLKSEIIASKFEHSYARTVYGVQGITIDEPYTIHKWDRLIENDKVVAIGRARKTEYINICQGCTICKQKVTFKSVSENEITQRFEAGTLEQKKEICLDIINRILRGKSSDEFSQIHTGLTVSELKTRLHTEDGIPRGFAIDHIKARASFTEEDIGAVNHYLNIQIIPEKLNSSKGAKEIKFYRD